MKPSTFKKTYQALRRQVREIARERNLPGREPEAFAYWFCQALLVDPDDDARIRQALVGQSNDRNVDILFISNSARIIYICQTKYRSFLMKKNEKLNDVNALAHIAASFAQPKSSFLGQFEHAAESVSASLSQAWDLVRFNSYSVRPVFVTTGRISDGARDEANSIVANVALSTGSYLDVEYDFYDGSECCRLFADFEDLVPAIPYIDFDKVGGHIRSGDLKDNLYAYVFAVETKRIAKIFHENQERLFARNVRLSKGDKSPINKEILRSLRAYPDEFFYLNNGITVLGSYAEPIGDTRIRVRAPQIINGQQTTRMIARGIASPKANARVLVKVIARTSRSDRDVLALRQFVQRIVRATNFQNKVKISELASNNPEHIRIERSLRMLGWRYVRKTGETESGHPVAWSGASKPFGKITLQALTTALVACLHSPQYIRTSGIEEIFEGLFSEEEESLYRRLFPDNGFPAEKYLFAFLCYRLAGLTFYSPGSTKKAIENHGRYYVTATLFEVLGPIYDNTRLRRDLLALLGAQSYRATYSPRLRALCQIIGRSWIAFYSTAKNTDLRSFISTTASKEAWRVYYHRSRKNARFRSGAKRLVASIRDDVSNSSR